jgi:V/A-type H+-transporting ATPase subunit C
MPGDLPLMIDFVEQAEYAYAVARVRALETSLVDSASISSLMTVPMERFFQSFQETAGAAGASHDAKDGDPTALMHQLERRFTDTFRLVRSLVMEEAMRRLIGLEYDYRLLNLLVKEARGVGRFGTTGGDSARDIYEARANVSFDGLRDALEKGRFTETGEIMYEAWRRLVQDPGLTGSAVDQACVRAFYVDLFGLLDENPNGFIRGYFLRRVDGSNVAAMLRQKLQGKKRADLAARFLPFGSIGLTHLEDGLDMTIDAFAGRIVFSPLAAVLRGVDKTAGEEEQIAEAERLIDDSLVRYLRESLFVTFGVEPVFAYLRLKEMELVNLRTILIGRSGGVPVEDIRGQMRGQHV